ncbi:alpha/beta hydrolase [Pseudoxanthomonas kalamensis DSM 18571]|nr:alpha/beta hydrolase [Pseudoxanthomonas kalamensis DSM 18571]
MLLVALALGLLLYAGTCTLLFWQQRSLIYFPQYTRMPADTTDIALQRPGGIVLRGWVVNPGQQDAAIYFGGNAESVQGNREQLAETLPGHTVYLFAYRGYGASDGVPDEASLIADALAVHDEVRRRHPAGRVDVIGRSLGSGVAVQLAAHRPVPRLVLVTPFDSLARVAAAHYPAFPVRLLLRDHFESIHYLPKHRGELLVLRAGRDNVVPPEHTDRLLRSFPGTAEVVAFADAGHDDISTEPGYWQSLRRFLESGPPSVSMHEAVDSKR